MRLCISDEAMYMVSGGLHRAEIVAAIRIKGISIAALSRANGLASSILAIALSRKRPKGEKIIAEYLGLQPQDIWPERYD
ncbi:helix-turn-helix domain-containing protein [Erwinia aphidicola]|uniref:helix-turn-helix domain-containing protein n=1 Tax=Erwinia aphidicola TaxID=68334 RepID=UPI003D20AB7B